MLSTDSDLALNSGEDDDDLMSKFDKDRDTSAPEELMALLVLF